jgi:membrane fusion protein, heavy metal efflux system
LAAKTAGIVSFSGAKALAGIPVKAGQALFTISSKGLTDNNTDVRQQEARNNLAKAKSDFERSQSLFNDRLITEKEYLQSKNEYDNARAMVNSLSGTYGAGGQVISATRSGFVKTLMVSEGQFVEAGQPLATISANKRLVIRADISPAVYAKIGNIHSANFRVNTQTVYSLQELNGKLISVGKAAADNLSVPVFFEIDSKEGLLSGTFVEVLLQTNAVDNALVIPVSALMEEQGNFYCYVQTAGESFARREVILGNNDGRQVQVISGINEGERVVTKGAYNIKLSTASGTMPAHGHEH